MTQAGLVTPRQIRVATALAFGFAVACGVYLVTVGGWPILIVGVLSILSGLAYTGGPFPLGYHGLGELFVFVFFGLVAVAGTYYVQALRLTPLVVWLACPIGSLSTAILVANNLRDAETDRRAGKMTLVARYGRPLVGSSTPRCLPGASRSPRSSSLSAPLASRVAAASRGSPRSPALAPRIPCGRARKNISAFSPARPVCSSSSDSSSPLGVIR